MLNNAIEPKFKAALQSSINICEIDGYSQKGQRSDKKEKTFKPPKKEPKAMWTDNQPTILLSTYSFSQNLCRT